MSKKVTTISSQRLHEIWDEGKRINLVDVRTAAEYRAGHVAGARLIPLDELSSETLAANEHYAGAGHEEALYLTCQFGMRAQQAAVRLIDAGYHNLAQYDSLFGKLLKLPDETLVYQAHDYNGMTVSTIGEEKRYSSRLTVADKQAYIDLMNSLVLEDPQLMDIAVPSNRQCGLKAAA